MADLDQDQVVSRISKALRKRTGQAWDVRAHRTTRNARKEGWILIRAPLARWISAGARGRRVMRVADVVALGDALQRKPSEIAEWIGLEICDADYERVLALLEGDEED